MAHKSKFTIQTTRTHLLIPSLDARVLPLAEVRKAVDEPIDRRRPLLIAYGLVLAYAEGVRLRALLELGRVREGGERAKED